MSRRKIGAILGVTTLLGATLGATAYHNRKKSMTDIEKLKKKNTSHSNSDDDFNDSDFMEEYFKPLEEEYRKSLFDDLIDEISDDNIAFKGLDERRAEGVIEDEVKKIVNEISAENESKINSKPIFSEEELSELRSKIKQSFFDSFDENEMVNRAKNIVENAIVNEVAKTLAKDKEFWKAIDSSVDNLREEVLAIKDAEDFINMIYQANSKDKKVKQYDFLVRRYDARRMRTYGIVEYENGEVSTYYGGVGQKKSVKEVTPHPSTFYELRYSRLNSGYESIVDFTFNSKVINAFKDKFLEREQEKTNSLQETSNENGEGQI